MTLTDWSLPQVLSADVVQALLRCVPQQDEIDKLMAFAGDAEQVLVSQHHVWKKIMIARLWRSRSLMMLKNSSWKFLRFPDTPWDWGNCLNR
jgi:hypothetical protein